MDSETNAVLDRTWFHDEEFEDGFWMRVVSCGPHFRARKAWWKGKAQSYDAVWELMKQTENDVNFFNQ